MLRELIAAGVRVHSVVTDCPYYLESIVKRFGKQDSAPAKFGSDGRFSRVSKGFMGQRWDGADENGERVAQDPEFWKLVYEVLLPGGYALAFSSPRTGHRQACAMEDAGFVMHPFYGWTYGQGLPKAKGVSNLLKKAGADTDDVEQWEGWYYGTQSCKPALEPIYFGQRPFDQSSGFRNVLVHGVGAINIEACRVASDGAELGRWPANLLHDGSDVVLSVFPQSVGQRGDLKGSEPSDVTKAIYGKFAGRTPFAKRDDRGSAARFFNSFPPNGSPVGYFGKAGKVDRAGSDHPTVKPIGLLRWLCRLVTPPGGTVLDPFAGSGTTGQAAIEEGFNSILIEREPTYADDIRWRFGLGKPRSIEILDMLGLADDVGTLLGAPNDLEELLG